MCAFVQESDTFKDSVSVSLQCGLIICNGPLHAMDLLGSQALAVELPAHTWSPGLDATCSLGKIQLSQATDLRDSHIVGLVQGTVGILQERVNRERGM